MKWLCFSFIVVLDFIACTMMSVSSGHSIFTIFDLIPFCGISLFMATAVMAVCLYQTGMFPNTIQKLIKKSLEDC